VQQLVIFVVWIVLLGLKGYAFIDCLRQPAQAFPAIGRQTKVLWLVFTGLAALTGLLPNLTLSIFGLAGAIAALIYLLDIRPKINEIMGR
jgi:predicted membrane metal-binding protein